MNKVLDNDFTTSDLINFLKKVEFGGATGRPRIVSFQINGEFMPEPRISIASSGDGLISEICLNIDGSFDQ